MLIDTQNDFKEIIDIKRHLVFVYLKQNKKKRQCV